MKTICKTLNILLLIWAGNITFAAGNDDGLFTRDYAVARYITAITEGKLEGLNEVIDADAKFCLMGKNIKSIDKKTMLDYLTRIGNIKQMCNTSTSIIEENAALTVVKVDMKYENFVRSNYVTIAHTAKGWKITNVCSIFR